MIATDGSAVTASTMSGRPSGPGSDWRTFNCTTSGTVVHHSALIPTVIDQNPCAHLRMPRDMIFHGWSMRLFQAWQHSATMSS